MALKDDVYKVALSVRLNNGTDSSGEVKTVGVNFPTLNIEGYTDEKAYAIAEKAYAVMSKSYEGLRKVTSSEVYDEG